MVRASYSALLLVVGNLKCKVYYAIVPSSLVKIRSAPELMEFDDPTTCMIHDSLGFSSSNGFSFACLSSLELSSKLCISKQSLLISVP